MRNLEFYLNHSGCHGGVLRNHRIKRSSRRLSNKKFHHIVFKLNRNVHSASLRTPKTFSISIHVIKSYAKRFQIKIASHSIQKDHIHLLVRTNRKSNYQNFFRVVAGQIAQRVTDTYHVAKFNQSFWKYRPFSRIVRKRKSYFLTKAYIRLNELEARRIIPYQKNRLKHLNLRMWSLLKVDPQTAGWKFYPQIIDEKFLKKRRDRYLN
jgi:putative transposase